MNTMHHFKHNDVEYVVSYDLTPPKSKTYDFEVFKRDEMEQDVTTNKDGSVTTIRGLKGKPFLKLKLSYIPTDDELQKRLEPDIVNVIDKV